MKILKLIFDFYIKSSLHVAVAVFCLVHISIYSPFSIEHNLYSMCVFFGTIVGYNFLKYYQVFINSNFRSNKYYSIQAVTFLAIIGFLFSFYFLHSSIQKLLLIAGFFVLIYPFLRKWGWIKLFFVSFVVTFITVYIPFQSMEYLPFEFYINLLQRFLILICLLIPFEIMDSKTDDKSLNTLPQLLGINSTKLFGILLVIPFILIEFLKLQPNYLVILIGIITVVFIDFSDWKRNKYYTSFWVESVPILWWLLLILFQ